MYILDYIAIHIYRGVSMAMKMPSRILKKECAGILEGMKVRVHLLNHLKENQNLHLFDNV